VLFLCSQHLLLDGGLQVGDPPLGFLARRGGGGPFLLLNAGVLCELLHLQTIKQRDLTKIM